MPHMAPRAVARFHTSPMKKAGANCATAANDKSPTCASAEDVLIIR